MISLGLVVQNTDGRSTAVTLPIQEVLLAGYTGRARATVMQHIDELKELGVAPPPRVPMVYVVPPSLLTTDDRLLVKSHETSGEVEFWLAPTGDGLLVGVGSDHTDREHEAIDVAESKTRCGKVISRHVWRYADVQDHWDAIEIRAWTSDLSGRRLYQEGSLALFLSVDDVLAEVGAAGHPEVRQRIVFGGTIATRGGLSYGRRFEAELRDPVLDRTLSCAYDVILENGD